MHIRSSRLALTLGAVALVVGFAGPGRTAAPTKDIVTTAVEAGGFNTLTKALDAAGLVETFTYHVVPGTVMAADVVKMSSAKTVMGRTVTIDTRGGVKVDNANVVKTDILEQPGSHTSENRQPRRARRSATASRSVVVPRDWPPRTEVAGTGFEPRNGPFRTLFAFIAGAEKMAMATPVETVRGGGADRVERSGEARS